MGHEDCILGGVEICGGLGLGWVGLVAYRRMLFIGICPNRWLRIDSCFLNARLPMLPW